jgi:hypothetical protein
MPPPLSPEDRAFFERLIQEREADIIGAAERAAAKWVKDVNIANLARVTACKGLLADYEALLPLVDRLLTFTKGLLLCCREREQRDAIVRELDAALARLRGRTA